jgi:hypothetical protein
VIIMTCKCNDDKTLVPDLTRALRVLTGRERQSAAFRKDRCGYLLSEI